MTALFLADLAVECSLKQVLVHVGWQLGKDRCLDELLGKVSKAIPQLNEPKLLGKARRLRQARNPVQHAASPPTATVVERQLAEAETFVAEVAKVAFEVDFRSLSVVNLVRADDLRQGLAATQQFLEKGDWGRAILYLGATFRVLVGYAAHWVRRGLGIEIHVERMASRSIHAHVIEAFGPKHPQATQVSLQDGSNGSVDDFSVLPLGFSFPELALLQGVEKRAIAIAQLGVDAKANPSLLLPKEYLISALELLARQVWRLEIAHPALLVDVGWDADPFKPLLDAS